MIKDYFPTTYNITAPREIQIDIFNKLESILGKKDEKHHKVVLCAPTGIGKSLCALTVLRYLKSTDGTPGLYTSPLNVLVDQVCNDFEKSEKGGYLRTLKGRAHYPCIAKPGENCDKGYCQSDICTLDPKKSRDCNSNKEECNSCPCWGCTYKQAMSAYKNSSIGNTNFTLFQLGVTNTDCGVVILDESDAIEDFVRSFHTVTLKTDDNDFSGYSDFDDQILLLEEYLIDLRDKQESIQNKLSNETSKSKIEHYRKINTENEDLISKIEFLNSDYQQYNEPWVCSIFQFRNGTWSTKFEPITTERFIQPMFENKTVIEMSATPIRHDNYDFIEFESPFSADIRPWIYKPINRMSLKYRKKGLPKLAKFLGTLNHKTIVHCHSYAFADQLGESLRNIGIYPLVQSNKFNDYNNAFNSDTVTRYDAISAFKSDMDPNRILLSVALARGIDLPEQDIINNVIAVLPFPNPTDPLVKAKNKLLGKAWQGPSMASTITQAYGRVNRNNKKRTITYIVDSNFGYWFKDNKKYFYNWFLEARVKKAPVASLGSLEDFM